MASYAKSSQRKHWLFDSEEAFIKHRLGKNDKIKKKLLKAIALKYAGSPIPKGGLNETTLQKYRVLTLEE